MYIPSLYCVGLKIAKMLNFVTFFFTLVKEKIKVIIFFFIISSHADLCLSLVSSLVLAHFLVFSYCASHITSSCGNSSESRLDLFWDLSPVASCRDQAKTAFPPRALPWFCLSSLDCHLWSVSSWPSQDVPWDANAVLFLQLHEKLYHWVWFNCVTLLLTNLYKV